MTTEGSDDAALLAVLATAQVRGYVGPGDLAPHIVHAQGFSRVLADAAGVPLVPVLAVDLGSGGGLPGLVLALWWPQSRWMLVDASKQRTEFLQEAVDELDLGDRVEVHRGRAEELARTTGMRGVADLVVARAFGAPAVVAECAAGFLMPGGHLVVSEPPGSDGGRWQHDDELALLGQACGKSVGGYQVIDQLTPCPDRYPRRVGIPAKRPLF